MIRSFVYERNDAHLLDLAAGESNDEHTTTPHNTF
jgi:hypothetical protein